MPILHHDGIDIHYQVDGVEGAPWLVFSNSLLTNLTMWDEQVAALQDRYRILRYDQRGHGETSVPAAATTIDVLAGDVLALVQAMEIEKASFIGISLGGATMLRFALSHPAYVDRLVACDTTPKAAANAGAAWGERIEHAKIHGMSGLADITIARWFPEPFVKAASPGLRKIYAMVAATKFDGFVACAQTLMGFDLSGEIAGMSVPTAAIAGELDGVVPEAMRKMCAAMPRARFHEIPGSGHLVNIDNPGLFLAALIDFLEASP